MKKHTFGDLLRIERKRAGKTLGELARHLQISLTFLSDVERDERPPLSAERIRAAAAYLETTEDEYAVLLRAAAEKQGSFELPVPQSSMGREVGAALQRGWANASDDDFKQLHELLEKLQEKKK